MSLQAPAGSGTRPPVPPPPLVSLKYPGSLWQQAPGDRCGCYLRVEPEIAGRVEWAAGGEAAASAAQVRRPGGRRCGAHGSEDRGAGAGAAPRQEGERGPSPGSGGGRPVGGARPGAEPGVVLARQALGARGRGSPVIPRGHRVPSGSQLSFKPWGVSVPIS